MSILITLETSTSASL